MGDGELKEINDLKEWSEQKFDNPEEKHSLFYSGIHNLSRKYLPKGKEYAKQRKEIHEKKSILPKPETSFKTWRNKR